MAHTVSGVLVAGVVSTVTVESDSRGGYEVVNRSQTGEIWVRADGTDPTVGGADSWVVLGARRFRSRFNPITVRLISTGALNYAVDGDLA